MSLDETDVHWIAARPEGVNNTPLCGTFSEICLWVKAPLGLYSRKQLLLASESFRLNFCLNSHWLENIKEHVLRAVNVIIQAQLRFRHGDVIGGGPIK